MSKKNRCSKILFIFGLLIGFVAAAHWDQGRGVIQNISPLYNKNVKDGMFKLKEGLRETGEKIKNTISK